MAAALWYTHLGSYQFLSSATQFLRLILHFPIWFFPWFFCFSTASRRKNKEAESRNAQDTVPAASTANISTNLHNNPAYETEHAEANDGNVSQSAIDQTNEYAYVDEHNAQTSPSNNEDEYAYADAETSGRPGSLGPPTSPQTGSPQDEEGWKKNSIYVTSDDVDDLSGTADNAEEGWADNSIYE